MIDNGEAIVAGGGLPAGSPSHGCSQPGILRFDTVKPVSP
jgi:hypothetical protein